MESAVLRTIAISRLASFGSLVLAGLLAATLLRAQTIVQSQPPASVAGPIAIVSINAKNPDAAPTVTGALEVTQGKAILAASGAITSGSQTTEVILPHRGVLRVCASTTVKLAADSSVPAGETPGLMMALDHGAVEASFATGRNSDILLTPDFRILIGGPGAAEIKVRLGAHGDTCVDNAGAPTDRSSSVGSNAGAPTDRSSSVGSNAGAPTDRSSSLGSNEGVNAPYVLVTSLFDGGDYRVQPGQRVMFEHGSVREMVDNEKESCGCPPPAKGGNEFPLAQSEGLAPLPKPAPTASNQSSAPPQVAPLVYNSADHVPQPAAAGAPAVGATATPPAAKKKPGFFSRVGGFFRRLFGAE